MRRNDYIYKSSEKSSKLWYADYDWMGLERSLFRSAYVLKPKRSLVYQNQFGVNQTLATHCRTIFGWLGDSTTPNLTLRKTTNQELFIELHRPAKFHGYLWMSWASKAEVFTDQAHTRDSDHQAESRNFWKKKSIRVIFHESFDTTSGTRLPKVLAIQKILPPKLPAQLHISPTRPFEPLQTFQPLRQMQQLRLCDWALVVLRSRVPKRFWEANFLLEEIRRENQLRLVVYPIIYWVLYIPGGWEWIFFPSTVPP